MAAKKNTKNSVPATTQMTLLFPTVEKKYLQDLGNENSHFSPL